MSKAIPSLKSLVSNREMAHFVKYKSGYLYYDVKHFVFPIPIEDTGNGEFPRTIKAVTLMRWIRKHLELTKEDEYEGMTYLDSLSDK